MAHVCRPGCIVAMLNPSEHMSVAVAEAPAESRGLVSTERASLVNWAGAAESNWRIGAADALGLFEAGGLRRIGTETRIGPGLAGFVRGRHG